VQKKNGKAGQVEKKGRRLAVVEKGNRLDGQVQKKENRLDRCTKRKQAGER
jgi:hypothetical protein